MVTFFLIVKMTHYAVLYIYERRWIHKSHGLGIANLPTAPTQQVWLKAPIFACFINKNIQCEQR